MFHMWKHRNKSLKKTFKRQCQTNGKKLVHTHRVNKSYAKWRDMLVLCTVKEEAEDFLLYEELYVMLPKSKCTKSFTSESYVTTYYASMLWKLIILPEYILNFKTWWSKYFKNSNNKTDIFSILKYQHLQYASLSAGYVIFFRIY